MKRLRFQWILVLSMAWTSLGAIDLDTSKPGDEVEKWLKSTNSRYDQERSTFLEKDQEDAYYPSTLRYQQRFDPKTGQAYYYDRLESRWYRYPVHFRGYHYNPGSGTMFRTQMAPGFQLFIDESKQQHRGHQSFGR